MNSTVAIDAGERIRGDQRGLLRNSRSEVTAILVDENAFALYVSIGTTRRLLLVVQSANRTGSATAATALSNAATSSVETLDALRCSAGVIIDAYH
jgi:hypothetical protein